MFLNGPFLAFFLYFCLFNTVDSKQMFNNFADDWIQTADLWYWKQPLYQLSHNHFTTVLNVILNFFQIQPSFSQSKCTVCLNATNTPNCVILFFKKNMFCKLISKTKYCQYCQLLRTTIAIFANFNGWNFKQLEFFQLIKNYSPMVEFSINQLIFFNQLTHISDNN